METERVSKEITPKAKDYSQWYLDDVLKADLADYGPVKGCMNIKPYGFAVWENMQRTPARGAQAQRRDRR